VAAQVVAAAGEDRVQLAVAQVQRAEDGGVDPPVDLQGRGRPRIEEDRPEALGDLSARA
jgi:hypothetical protein